MTNKPLPKFPKIKRIGDESNAGIFEQGDMVIHEKMDGGNFRMTLEHHLDEQFQTDDRELVFGSRNICYKNDKDIDSAFEHVIEFVREQTDVSKLKAIEGGDGHLALYGEAMHPHTLEYDWDRVPSFLGFAILDVESGEFLPWDQTRVIFSKIGLPVVPVYHWGDADGIPDTFDPSSGDGIECPESNYRNGLPEGVVIWNYATGQIAKYRTPEFKERQPSQSVTDADDYEPSDSIVLARQYTTEARVLKMIHKYEDRGETIEMGLMEDLWRAVFDDVIEEEYEEILLGNYTIDTKEFRSEVASITANVLEAYLNRPDGSVLNERAESEDTE